MPFLFHHHCYCSYLIHTQMILHHTDHFQPVYNNLQFIDLANYQFPKKVCFILTFWTFLSFNRCYLLKSFICQFFNSSQDRHFIVFFDVTFQLIPSQLNWIEFIMIRLNAHHFMTAALAIWSIAYFAWGLLEYIHQCRIFSTVRCQPVLHLYFLFILC